MGNKDTERRKKERKFAKAQAQGRRVPAVTCPRCGATYLPTASHTCGNA